MFRTFVLPLLLVMFFAQRAIAHDFYVGSKVVTDTHYHGTITSVYEDGSADVSFDLGINHNWPLSRLHAILTSINDFSVNQRVIAVTNGKSGRIVNAYPDGTVDVHFDNLIGLLNWPTNRLCIDTKENEEKIRSDNVGQL